METSRKGTKSVEREEDNEECQACTQHEWTCGYAKYCGRVSHHEAEEAYWE